MLNASNIFIYSNLWICQGWYLGSVAGAFSGYYEHEKVIVVFLTVLICSFVKKKQLMFMFNLCYCVYKQEVELDKQNLAAAFPKDWMEFKFFFSSSALRV